MSLTEIEIYSINHSCKRNINESEPILKIVTGLMSEPLLLIVTIDKSEPPPSIVT